MFDASLVIILLMAIFTVSVGSMWSGFTKKRLLDSKKDEKRPHEPSEGENEDQERIYGTDSNQNKQSQEEISLQVTPFLILGFVCCMCLMLLCLYFFFDKLGKIHFFLNIVLSI